MGKGMKNRLCNTGNPILYQHQMPERVKSCLLRPLLHLEPDKIEAYKPEWPLPGRHFPHDMVDRNDY